tara:strand:+ start:392 stop:994 length:603 start_codon:yes stop_codon:yes gene_type:complete
MRSVDPTLLTERRRQILEAALICFREKGFHGASMSSICKKAKMSPGHLYHYFESKNALISAIVQSDVSFHEEKLASLVENGNTLETMLSRINEIWQLDKDLDAALYSEIMAEASRNPEAAAVIRQHEIRLRERFAKVIAYGQEQGHIDPKINALGFASVIIACVSGLRIADLANTHLDRKTATESLATMISRTLLPQNKV